MIRGLRTS